MSAAFSIEDQTGEMSPEEIAAAEDLAEEILDLIADDAETPVQAMQSLTAVIAYILGETALSRSHANDVMKKLVMSVLATLEEAEKDCRVNWNQRSRH